MAQKLKNALDKDVQQELKELLQQETWDEAKYVDARMRIKTLMQVYKEKYNSCNDNAQKKEYYGQIYERIKLYSYFIEKLCEISYLFYVLRTLHEEVEL